MGSRLGELGKLLYTPDALVLHDHSRGLKDYANRSYHYGGWRRESRVWDWQVIPPILVPLVILSLIFTRWVFLGMLFLYLAATIIMGVYFAIRERDPRYLFSIPIVYTIEHSLYIIGFWKETILPKKTARKTKR